MTINAYPDALPVQYRLHWYVLERVLGQGGFGITYLARDTNLDRLVAIKEYLPSEVARRDSDAKVRERTNAQGERYSWGLERFIAEARTLARFDHPNIVRVHAVFEDNATAYMVMRFEEGENLAALLKQRGTLTEDELLRILLPILNGLEQVHGAKFIHRDIKPENIHIRRDGSPVLLDFGSARQSLGRIRTMTILVAPGYAPLEQYYGDPETQGPWTDIYSLAATCYRAIAGNAPLDAIARTKGVLGSPRDVLVPATVIGHGRYSDRLLRALDHALELREKERPQTIAEWRKEIIGDVAPRQNTPGQAASPEASAKGAARTATRSPRRTSMLWAAGGAALAAVVIGIVLLPSVQDALSPLAMKKPTPPPALLEPPPGSSGKVKGEKLDKPKVPKPAPPIARVPKTAPPKLESPHVPSPSPAAPPPVAKLEPPAPAAKPEPPPPVAKPEPPPEHGGKPPAQSLLEAQAAIKQGDYAAAIKILKPLVSAGNPRAQLLLGDLEARGNGLPQNNNDAYLWYSLAARKGITEATPKRNEIARKLQAAEIRQLDRIVESWQPTD